MNPSEELPTVVFPTVSRWPLRVAIGVVIVFVAISALAVVQIARGVVVVDCTSSAILLSIATVGVVSWAVALILSAWRQM